MNYMEYVRAIHRSPWALIPDRLFGLSAIVSRLSAGEIDKDEARAAAVELAATQKKTRSDQPGIAVIPIHGFMMAQDSCCFGTMGTRSMRQAVIEATGDPNVVGIILDIDSPGGSVYGTPELAEAVYQASQEKPVWSLADSLAASAAYWVGSQASKFFAAPSGDVGSIGVFTLHEDHSKALEDAGIKTTLISAGKFKTEGHPFGPLSKEAVASIQEHVNDTYEAFVAAVARGREVTEKDVSNGFGEGRVVSAKRALEMNMIDGIATFDQVLGAMLEEIGATATNRGSRAEAIDNPDVLAAGVAEDIEPESEDEDGSRTEKPKFRGSSEWRKRQMTILDIRNDKGESK